MATIQFVGNHGTVYVDALTAEVVQIDGCHGNGEECGEPGCTGYLEYEGADLADWYAWCAAHGPQCSCCGNPPHADDVLNVGRLCANGYYEPPEEDHRQWGNG